MVKFRVETVLDNVTGYYFKEVYCDEESTPLVAGKPIYRSREQAIADAIQILKNGMHVQLNAACLAA
jgi:hypothetical protein